MPAVPCRVVGLSSLCLDGHEGTPRERHVVFADLDGEEATADPRGLRLDARRIARSFHVPDFYLFRTLKGVHVVSFGMFPLRTAERISEAFEPWGSDGFHRFMGYKNGETVLRVTAKPGENGGPRCVGRVPGPRTCLGEWSVPHWEALRSLGHQIAPPSAGSPGNVRGLVRVHEYDTTAVVP